MLTYSRTLLLFLCHTSGICAQGESEALRIDKKGCKLEGDGLDIHFIDGQDKTSEDLRLEISWWNLKPSRYNKIGFWNKDPKNFFGPPIKYYPVLHYRGSLIVDGQWFQELDNITHDIGSLPKCLNLWTGLIKNGTLVKTVCLKLRAMWMENTGNVISPLKLSDVILPGVSMKEAFSNRAIWLQLINGVRYFEILTKYSYENATFTVSNNEVLINIPLSAYLSIIDTFLSQTNEIIILELNVLPYSDFLEKSGKAILEDFLVSLFGQKIALTEDFNCTNPIFGDLWKNNKKLIITTTLPMGYHSKVLWKSPPSLNFTATLNKKLLKYFRTEVSRRKTKQELWVIEGPKYSVEYLNDPTSSRLFEIITQRLWKEINIVSLPGVLGAASLTSLAVKANINRLFCHTNKQPKRSPRSWKRNRKLRAIDQTDACDELTDDGSKIFAWPTVQATPKNSQYRLIQINWKSDEVLNGDYVGLYNLQDSAQISVPGRLGRQRKTAIFNALYIKRPYASEGAFTTNITFPRPDPDRLIGGGCYDYYAVYIRDGKVASYRCIESHPKWIWENRSVLGSRSLRSLVLPGTHNAGSFSTTDYHDYLVGWVVCQDQDILSQLIFGIRYLDLRIGYYPETEELLWINHDVVKWIPLQRVLDDIRTFAFMSPDPVIIDVHKLPVGFDQKEAARLLISYINTTLGEYLLPASLGTSVSLQNIWTTGRSLIVSIWDPKLEEDIPWLWPPIPQSWADAQTTKDLISFLETEIRRRKWSHRLWAAMGHLTASVWDIMLRSKTGNRGLADRVGRPLTDLLRFKWRRDINIITTDFFLAADTIWTSIILNVADMGCFSQLQEQIESSTDNITLSK